MFVFCTHSQGVRIPTLSQLAANRAASVEKRELPHLLKGLIVLFINSIFTPGLENRSNMVGSNFVCVLRLYLPLHLSGAED